jgi:hypothetical protein
MALIDITSITSNYNSSPYVSNGKGLTVSNNYESA